MGDAAEVFQGNGCSQGSKADNSCVEEFIVWPNPKIKQTTAKRELVSEMPKYCTPYNSPLLGLHRALSYSSQGTAPFRGLQADGRCCCGESCANTVRLVSGYLVWNSYVDCMVYDCHGDSRLPVES